MSSLGKAMTGTVFDTLKATDMLTSAGIAEEHARAITATMRDAVSQGVATKADIADLKADMLKVAIGIVVAVVLANAGLTFAIVKVLVVGAG